MQAATQVWVVGPNRVEEEEQVPYSTNGHKTVSGSNIQIEEGNFTRIHNDILEALAKSKLTGMEWSALMFLFRQTYGWGRREDAISYSQFAEAMGVKRHHALRALQKLEERNIIHSTDNGNNRPKVWRFNKYVGTWDVESMRQIDTPQGNTSVTPQGNSLDVPKEPSVTPQGNTSVTPQGNKTVTPQGNYQRKKEKERKGDNAPLPGITGDPLLDAAASKFNRRRNGQPVYGRQFDTAEWNLQVPAAERTPIAEAIADITGKRAKWEAGLDDNLHVELHRSAITAHRMGYTTPDSIAALTPQWRADWRGKNGGSLSQFVDFLSEQKTLSEQGKDKRQKSEFIPIEGVDM